MIIEQITYGSQTIDFELTYSERKTLGITVNPDLSVQVKAPQNASREKIFKKVEKRVSWIIEQKQYFLSFQPRRKGYLYKTGENHYYLGRRYQLKIIEGHLEADTYKLKLKTTSPITLKSCWIIGIRSEPKSNLPNMPNL